MTQAPALAPDQASDLAPASALSPAPDSASASVPDLAPASDLTQAPALVLAPDLASDLAPASALGLAPDPALTPVPAPDFASVPDPALTPAPAPASVPDLAPNPASAPASAPAGAAQYAARLQALLGDPRDARNPYGRAALRAAGAAGGAGLPAPPAFLPGAGDVPGGADELARALRPLFRRDLALAHAWSIRPLLTAPVPHPAAALLGPAALLAAAGGVLLGAARIVEGLGRHQTAARQWRPVLATVFADLLACESLTATALRTCPPSGQPADKEAELLAAVTGYLVPRLAVELLGDLELVLNECGFDAHTVERRTLARLVGDRELAGAGRRATNAAQARIVEGLGASGGTGWDDGPRLTALFHDTATTLAATAGTTAPAGAGACPPPGAVTGPAATAPAGTGFVPAATAPPGADPGADPDPGADDDDAAAGALARFGRRLATERRALRTACAAQAVHDPADPAARALADRQALLVLATATTAVREAAAAAGLPFLGDAGWTLPVLGRITVRLGLPLPTAIPDAQPRLWQELARRAADGVDCDLYATRPAW
ncbi:hypothetical protein [Streptomyces sp. NPDC018036]|uniref:hypothetical protein n=1 Tax=Streptomyces sp. NPDC018036 TaxID=3365035 RepID=UPI0037B0ABE6